MTGKSKIIITWLIASLLPAALAGQDISAGNRPASEKLENYCRSNPFEELWLHTDREIYAAGEAVRIKGYLLSYPELKLASYDSYVYAEILAHDNRPVAQSTIMVEEGSGTVILFLPDTLSSGTYLLRAYTAVMKNYMPHGCFMKSITVVNPFSDRRVNLFTGTKSRNDPPSEVIFLPEGGALINGTGNRTGIITLNRYGFPVSCNGRLENEEGLTVTRVTSDSTGTGSFSFTPAKGVQYYFIAENGSERYPLPVASDKGIMLSADYDDEGSVTVRAIQISEGDELPYRSGIMLIQARGKILHSEKITFRKEEFRTVVPAEDFTPGINNIALFDADGNFLCERYLFIPSTERSHPLIICTQPEKRRANIRIEIERTVSGAGSLSVSVPSPGKEGLLASEYLMLGSEIRLPVNLPSQREAFPFLSTEAKNILLLGATSNWIDWVKIDAGTYKPHIWHDEREGRFLYLNQPAEEGQNTLNGRKAYLTAFGLSPSFQYSEDDGTGRYTFFIEKKDHINEIIISVEDDGVNRPVNIESRYSDRYLPSLFPADTLPAGSDDEAEQLTVRYQVRKIYGITDTASVSAALPVRRPPFRLYGRADQEVILDDYIALSSIREIFFELVKRVSVRSGRDGAGSVIYDPTLRRSPALFIDLVPVNDADIVLDIITGDYIAGDALFPGIISVTTHEGNYNDIRLPDNTIRIPWKMHDLPKAFITPDYGAETSVRSHLPDFRNTLYWNDGPVSDSGGTTVYEFPSSDDTGDYQIIFNMFTHTGDIISVRSKLSLAGIL
jgi:hypothetical protein